MMTQSCTQLTPLQAASCCSPVDDLLDPEWFKALCDPTRVLLLSCLLKCARPCAVGEIAECCAVDVSVVSRHLGVLQRAGILESTKQGRAVFYTARTADLCATLRSLADAIEHGSVTPPSEPCCNTSPQGTNS